MLSVMQMLSVKPMLRSIKPSMLSLMVFQRVLLWQGDITDMEVNQECQSRKQHSESWTAFEL